MHTHELLTERSDKEDRNAPDHAGRRSTTLDTTSPVREVHSPLSPVLLLVLVVSFLAVSTAEAQSVRRSQPNVAGVELLGRGLIYSVNYERYVRERVGVGVGIAILGSTGASSGAAIVPIYLSLNPVGDTHSLYIGTGVTVGIVESGASAGAFGTATVGYQYRSGDGFIIRPSLSVLFAGDLRLLWPGITLARSF